MIIMDRTYLLVLVIILQGAAKPGHLHGIISVHPTNAMARRYSDSEALYTLGEASEGQRVLAAVLEERNRAS